MFKKRGDIWLSIQSSRGQEKISAEKPRFTSGCLTGVAIFIILSSLTVTIAIVVGSASATIKADLVARTMQPIVCPTNSTAQIVTYASSTTDEYGNRLPSTAYELQCVDASGTIVKSPGPAYAFYWTGLLMAAAILISAFIAIILATPVATLLTRLIKSMKKRT